MQFGRHTILCRLSGPLSPDTAPSLGDEDCPECWYKKTFPRFVFPLSNRFVSVEGGFSINGALQKRGYRKGKGEGTMLCTDRAPGRHSDGPCEQRPRGTGAAGECDGGVRGRAQHAA
jgi:hypothetical protein